MNDNSFIGARTEKAAGEKQMQFLQFIKKVKLTPDKTKLFGELTAFFENDRADAELLYEQLIHNDLAVIRKFAVSFYEYSCLEYLRHHIKSLLFVEDDIENLTLSLKNLSGFMERPELIKYFSIISGARGKKEDLIASFLEAECKRLSIDFKLMLDNAVLQRKQLREKKAEKKKKDNEPLALSSVVASQAQNPANIKYAVIMSVIVLLLIAGCHIYSYMREGYLLKSALAAIDDYDENLAFEKLRALSEDYPENLDGLFNLHRIYCENYKINEANIVLNQIISIKTDSYMQKLAEVRNSIVTGDMQSAADYFLKAPAAVSSRPEVEYLKLYYEYMNSKLTSTFLKSDYKRIFDRLETLNRNEIKGYKPYITNLMITLSVDGDFTSLGKSYFDEAMKITSTDFKSQLACAYYSEKTGNLNKALELYELAAGRETYISVYEYAAINAGRIALGLKNYETAVKYYTKWRDIASDDIGPYLALLEVYGRTRDIGGLNSIFAEAEKKFQNNPMLYYNLGLIKISSGEYEEAIKNLGIAVKLKPQMLEANYNLARANQLLGEKFAAHSVPWVHAQLEALKYYEACLKIDEKYEPAYISIGIISLSKNPPDYVTAIEKFNTALKIDPSSKEAMLNIMTAGYLKKDDAVVRKMKKMLAEKYPGDSKVAEIINLYELKK